MTMAAALSKPLMLGRLEVRPDLSGALWLAAERTLVVTDLHLEKGSAYARRGQMLPPYDTRTTLARLTEVVTRLSPRRVIALGDSFHDTGAGDRMSHEDMLSLASLQSARDWLWVSGNHDPDVPAGIGGECCSSIEIGGVQFVHEPSSNRVPQVAGHLHPAAKIRMRGRAVRRRCFVMTKDHCIMPAMGAYAGGLNVRDKAFSLFLEGIFQAHMLGEQRLYVVDGRLLLPD